MPQPDSFSKNSPNAAALALLAVSLLLALFASHDAMSQMWRFWQREEYSHSFLIPVVAIALLYQRIPNLKGLTLEPSWAGVLVVFASSVLLLIGELSALYTLVHYALIGITIGLVVTVLGVRASKILWIPLAYLLFMVPLPNFLYFNLSQALQLLSSELGVVTLRLFGVSVFLEGNIIDLGVYQLQVAEACSGLRYLFPLASFGFLLGALFRAHWWERTLVFLATLPITLLMNSFRIATIGLLVEHWGIGQAEGFLHYFEGWVVFLGCLALLLVLMWIMHRLDGSTGPLLDRLDLSLPSSDRLSVRYNPKGHSQPIWAAVGVLLLTAATTAAAEQRQEITPERTREFREFPMLHGQWLGRETTLAEKTLSGLKVTDYLLADYRRLEDHVLPVNLYIAYYDTQRKGASVHSPRSCIPGGGWEIQSLTQMTLPNTNMSPLKIRSLNRVVVQRGRDRQLVYYWFNQRSRRLTNEYLVKWYLLIDGILQNRSDGSMVRVTAPIPDGMPIEEADSVLQEFLDSFEPLIGSYLPSDFQARNIELSAY